MLVNLFRNHLIPRARARACFPQLLMHMYYRFRTFCIVRTHARTHIYELGWVYNITRFYDGPHCRVRNSIPHNFVPFGYFASRVIRQKEKKYDDNCFPIGAFKYSTLLFRVQHRARFVVKNTLRRNFNTRGGPFSRFVVVNPFRSSKQNENVAPNYYSRSPRTSEQRNTGLRWKSFRVLSRATYSWRLNKRRDIYYRSR